MLIFADGAAELKKLVVEVDRTDLVKVHLVSKPENHNPEIVIFCVDANISGNTVLDNAVISFKKFFEGKRGQNVVVSLDPGSFRRLARVRRLNVFWDVLPFSIRRSPLQCYNCWKYSHMAKNCCSTTSCGNYGNKDHIRNGCTGSFACPNCTRVNSLNPPSKALPTGHAAVSRECYVFCKELALTEKRNYGQ